MGQGTWRVSRNNDRKGTASKPRLKRMDHRDAREGRLEKPVDGDWKGERRNSQEAGNELKMKRSNQVKQRPERGEGRLWGWEPAS